MWSLENLQGKRICVAYSGGVDSTVLLHYLLSKREQLHFTLSAVHCEHGLRGEDSEADMRFVQEQCRAWNVPLMVYREDCKARAKKEKCSEETAGRNFRRAVFAEIIQTNVADCVATAHHENDEAETVLFRLARGSALGGASGMRQQDGWLIRPLLHWSREEIERYAKQNQLAFCVDETNFENRYTRNQIRQTILPKLEEAVPGAVGNLSRFAHLAKEDDDFLQQQSEKLILDDAEGLCVAFCEDAPLFRRACLKALKTLLRTTLTTIK